MRWVGNSTGNRTSGAGNVEPVESFGERNSRADSIDDSRAGPKASLLEFLIYTVDQARFDDDHLDGTVMKNKRVAQSGGCRICGNVRGPSFHDAEQ